MEDAKSVACISEPHDFKSGLWSKSDPSGVFWCKREAIRNPKRMADERMPLEEMEFLLVFVNPAPSRRLTCAHSIPIANEPLKLRVHRGKKIPLSHFVYASNPRKSGPKGHVTRGPVVDTGDDSVGDLWYCHKGQWLYLFYH